MATAGTIIDKNTSSDNPATNTNPATESICPKGWTLPDTTQTRSISGSTTYVSSFSPVLGGYYHLGTLVNEATRGAWWGSETYTGAKRYTMVYNGSSLSTGNGYRYVGLYVRCVQAP